MNKSKLIIMATVCLFMTTGCWDRRDPEDREYIITMGVDKGKDGLIFSFAPAKTTAEEAEPLTSTGITLGAAVAKNDSQNAKKTELGQLKMIIFGKSVLEDRTLFAALLEELERSSDISKKTTVLATASLASQCIAAILENDSETGLFLWDFYKNTAKEVAVTQGLDLDTFITRLAEQEGCGILPKIDEDEGRLHMGGGIALAEGEYAFTLSDNEERGYLFLSGEAEGAVLEAERDGKTLPLRIVRSEEKYSVSKKDGKYVLTVTPVLEGSLLGSGQAPAFDPTAIKKLENIFVQLIKSEIENTINIAKDKNGEAIYGFESRLRQAAPDISGDFWENAYVSVEPRLKIRDTGRIR